MELYHLIYAITLAKTKNFSHAADMLFIAQPTLSQQIKKLEEEIGFQIFQRNTRSVTLTSYGEMFVARAERIIEQVDALQKWVVQIGKLKNSKISFGASALTTPHATACVSEFMLRFPGAQIDYTEQWDPKLSDMVREGKLDMALVALPKNKADRMGLSIHPIGDEYVCVVISKKHPLSERPSVSLQDLSCEQIVTTSSESGLTRLMKNEFTLQGLEPNFMMNLISIEARLSMVQKGAITFVMNEQFKLYDQAGLSVIPIEPKIYRTMALITVENRKLSVLERSFIDIVKDGVLHRLNGLPKCK